MSNIIYTCPKGKKWKVVAVRTPKKGEFYIPSCDSANVAKVLYVENGKDTWVRPIVVPYKWRAWIGGRYFFVTSFGEIDDTVDGDYSIDQVRFKAGNYFQTQKEAEAVAAKVREVFNSHVVA